MNCRYAIIFCSIWKSTLYFNYSRNGYLKTKIIKNNLLFVGTITNMEAYAKSETLVLREKLIGKSCQLFFKKDPLKIVKGKDQYMYDEVGNAYLDCINNVAHVGHSNPCVSEACSKQMQLINTNSRYLHDNILVCAQKIVDTLPDELSVCFFVNSGSEANDLALRMARIHTGNEDVIALEHAYHGHLTSLMEISHYKFNQPNCKVPRKDYVHIASCPDVYRGKYRAIDHSHEELGELYADDIKEICENLRKSNKGIAAYIAESFQSCGGQILPPKNYFKKVYEHVRNAGGVCIADEVQVGFGRVGTNWWAFQQYNVVPDIVTMGKSMGNGYPVACVVTTQQVARSFAKNGGQYFNTYGGNPVACAIATSVIDYVEKNNLKENAVIVGEYLMDSCYMLSKKHKLIGDVRGQGLFVGIELVQDLTTKEPHKACAQYVVERMRKEHILVSVDGPENNVIKFKPPMTFSKQNVDEVAQALDRVLKEFRKQEEQILIQTKNTGKVSNKSMNRKDNVPVRKRLEDTVKSI